MDVNGCHSAELQDIHHPHRMLLTSELVDQKIKTGVGFYEGICWLGGDPLYQFEDFINISQELKYNYPSLLNCLFTRL